MTDSIIVTDNTSNPKGVTTHIVENGKWVVKAFQPFDLGYGVPPLTGQQAERISRRIAILLGRHQHNLPGDWP